MAHDGLMMSKGPTCQAGSSEVSQAGSKVRFRRQQQKLLLLIRMYLLHPPRSGDTVGWW